MSVEAGHLTHVPEFCTRQYGDRKEVDKEMDELLSYGIHHERTWAKNESVHGLIARQVKSGLHAQNNLYSLLFGVVQAFIFHRTTSLGT